MSDIPNPIGSFEIFAPKKVKALKISKPGRLQNFSKKIAKKLFGKKFATKARAELRTAEVIPAAQIDKIKKPAFKIIWASTPGEIKIICKYSSPATSCNCFVPIKAQCSQEPECPSVLTAVIAPQGFSSIFD